MLSRIIPMLEGVVRYRNPLQIAVQRFKASRDSQITIVDRATGIRLIASARAYPMFGETWYTREYDIPECPVRPGDTVIDIGAHQGFFTCYAAHKGATVHAFEPFGPSYERLKANVEVNGLSSRVRLTQAAVTNHSGSASMRCFSDLGGGCNTIVETHLPNTCATEVRAVDAVDANAALAQAGQRVRLCKIDSEGAELDIIRALENPDRVDAFALEFHPYAYSLMDLVAAMRAWGTHQLSFSRTSNVLYAVAHRCLDEYAHHFYR